MDIGKRIEDLSDRSPDACFRMVRERARSNQNIDRSCVPSGWVFDVLTVKCMGCHRVDLHEAVIEPYTRRVWLIGCRTCEPGRIIGHDPERGVEGYVFEPGGRYG